MKKPKKFKTAATLTIHGPGRMSKQGRGYIVRWLRKKADDLSKDGHRYTDGRFRARYLYR